MRTLTPILLLAAAATASAETAILEASDGLTWRRGNMHTHSHWSDGDDYLESIGLWYREQGYNFLVFTDHNVLANTERWVTVDKTKGGRIAYGKLKESFSDWVEDRGVGGELQVRLRRFDEVAERLNRTGDFLLIQGEEISDSANRLPVHLNVSNVETLIEPRHGRDVFETIQNNVRAVLEQRVATGRPMIVHLNHPNFGYAVTAEDLMRVQGERFFEVYNGHPGVRNTGDDQHAGTEQVWDIVLAHRIAVFNLPIMYGLAVDDGHNYHGIPNRNSNPGRGWVMVLTSELTAEALIDALEAGRFYASSGVKLDRITSDGSGLSVEVAAEPGESYVVEFIGTRHGADLAGVPVVDDQGEVVRASRRYNAQVGEVLRRVEGATGRYDFSGDELYVRARVTSSRRHPNPSEPGDFEQAWVQPVLGPGAQLAASQRAGRP